MKSEEEYLKEYQEERKERRKERIGRIIEIEEKDKKLAIYVLSPDFDNATPKLFLTV